MPSDTLNPQDLHNDGSFTAQFMDHSFDPNPNYPLQGYRNPTEFNNFQQSHNLDPPMKQELSRSASPLNSFSGDSYAPQTAYDFQLYGAQEPPQHINPALFDQPSQNQGIDPAALMQHHSPGLPPQTIPSTHQGLTTLNQGLDYNWEGVLGNPSFRTHRPPASERSDVSSAAASPLFSNQEYTEHHSPLIGSISDFLNNDQALGLDAFTLSESVHHTPVHSPRMPPMPGQGHVSGANSPFLVPQDVQFGYPAPQAQMMMPPPPLPQDPLQDLRHRLASHDAMQYQGPQIQIEFAPPQRQPTFPGKPGFGLDEDALSPPPKCMLCLTFARIY